MPLNVPRFFQRRLRTATSEAASASSTVETPESRQQDEKRRTRFHSKITQLIQQTYYAVIPKGRRRKRKESKGPNKGPSHSHQVNTYTPRASSKQTPSHIISKPTTTNHMDKSLRSHNSLACTATSSISCDHDSSGRYLENMIIFTQQQYQPEQQQDLHQDEDEQPATDDPANLATTDSSQSTTASPLPDDSIAAKSAPAFGTPIEDVYAGVHDGPILGSGLTGHVRRITHRQTHQPFALKVLDLTSLVESQLLDLRQEIFILCQLDHPNIVTLEEVYESDMHIYLVQELCCGGELFDCLEEQPEYHYTEAETKELIRQMLCAVRYLHSKGIIHRDLKLENFLFTHKGGKHPLLKMIDFGLSKFFCYGEVQCDTVGTPYTVAPEVIHGSYDERCDMWGVAVLCYVLLSGETPFGGDDPTRIPMSQVKHNILQGRYAFEPHHIWKHVSADAHAFIESLLVLDPKERPTARMAQQHPWLK